MITVSKEDYLKAILEAESEGESVISATLAHWLSVSPPAVTMAVRRLKRDGLVRVKVKGGIRLTAAGRKMEGKAYLVSGIYERDRNLLEFLDTRGIRPGARLQLLARNVDQTLSIRTSAGAAVIGRPAAEKVWVHSAAQQRVKNS